MEELKNILKNDNYNIDIDGRICHHRIKILYALSKYFNLKKYLEIGVHNGSSMSYVLQSESIEKCIGIDPFENLETNDSSMTHYQNIDKINISKSSNNINNNNKYNSEIILLQDYSNNINENELDNDIDLLFIDGDHNYDAVLNDYNKFFNNVKTGGFIVFDDLHQKGPKKVFNEIINNDTNIELFGIYEETEGILIKK